MTGRTGSGKTTLANALLYARQYVISFRSKERDDSPLPGKRIKTVEYIRRAKLEVEGRFVLDPAYGQKAAEFAGALELAHRETGWTVYIDELWHVLRMRRDLEPKVERLLTQGRSASITMVYGAQRPVNVSRFAMSQATHLIAFKQDRRDAMGTLRDAGTSEWGEIVSRLPQHYFAWLHVPTDSVFVGCLQDLYNGNALQFRTDKAAYNARLTRLFAREKGA